MSSLLSQINDMKPSDFPDEKAWAIYCQGFKTSPHHNSPAYEWMGQEGQIMVDVMFFHNLPAISLYESVEAFIEMGIIEGPNAETVFNYILTREEGEDLPIWVEALLFYVDFYMKIQIEEKVKELRILKEELYFLDEVYGRKPKPIIIK